MDWSDKVEVYRGRKPRESPSWQLFDNHLDEFEYRYDEFFSREYGFFRPVISHIVRKYLECGDLEQGFARVRCPDCHHEYLLAFSCRGRWFCPSCHSKKVVQFGSHLQDNVLFSVPHRQYVFSIPKIIRRYFLHDRKLLGKLSQCGGLMKIVSFIYEHRAIKKILAYLGLSEDAKSKRERAPPFPQIVGPIIERMMMVGLTMSSHLLMCKRCDCIEWGGVATGQLTETP